MLQDGASGRQFSAIGQNFSFGLTDTDDQAGWRLSSLFGGNEFVFPRK
jgi:hypothetical protein